MSMIVRRGENDYQPIPPGRHSAVCVNCFDLGLQSWDGEVKPKVALLFEVAARQRGGERYHISKEFTFSLNTKAALRAFLEAWRGASFTEAELDAGFDLEKLRGAPCEIGISERQKANGGSFAAIEWISRLTKKGEKLKPETSINYIPEWVQRKIDAQIIPGYEQGTAQASAPSEEYLDEVPF